MHLARAGLIQPAFADAGLGAELDAAAPQAARPIPLARGRGPRDQRPGWLITRLHDQLQVLSQAEARVARSSGSERHRTGQVRVLLGTRHDPAGR